MLRIKNVNKSIYVLLLKIIILLIIIYFDTVSCYKKMVFSSCENLGTRDVFESNF